MIDLSRETPLTLAQAARNVPGKPVHVSTLHRWRLRGARGVQLETFLRGGVRFTTVEALQRFFQATTIAADGDHQQADTMSRSAQIAEADSKLRNAGF